MLSQQDLDQFKTIVAEEVSLKTRGIATDIHTMKGEVGKIAGLEKDIQAVMAETAKIPDMQKEMKGMKSELGKIHADIDTIIRFFDRDTLELRGRVERIEKHLGLQALS